LRLVLVEWVDSFGCSSSWAPLEECEPKALTCRSVGWLIHDGDDCKTVVPHLVSNHPEVRDQGCGDMTIPASAVRKIVDIELPA